MRRITGLCGVLVAALAVTVPVGLADNGPTTGSGQTEKPAAKCGRTMFAGTIMRVGVDGLAVSPVRSETGKPLVVRLTDETVVKQADTVVGRSALAPGKKARFYVRVCHREERRLITARLIVLAPAGDNPTGEPPAPPKTEDPPATTEPTPAADTCFTGEANVKIVGITDSSITILRTTSEGTKELIVKVNGDTVVRKNDVTVDLAALKVGDFVHLNIVYCKSGSVRAVRILFLHSAETPA